MARPPARIDHSISNPRTESDRPGRDIAGRRPPRSGTAPRPAPPQAEGMAPNAFGEHIPIL